MRVLVVDTNIVSYLLKRHSFGEAYRYLLQDNLLSISFMTVAELHEGAVRAKWGTAKLAHLDRTMENYTVVQSSKALSLLWAEIRAARWRQPIGVADAWVAATAIACDCPLVTHNPKDFGGIPDLKVLTVTL